MKTDFDEWRKTLQRPELWNITAKDAWNAAQKAERERIKQIVDEVGRQGNHDKWFDCADAIAARIEE